MLKDNNILVVGAGITGITIANVLSKYNRITIIQNKQHIGGNCFDYIDDFGNLIHKYGAHLFHTNNANVWNYISKFSKWHLYQHKVLCKIKDQFYNMPININTINKYFGLSLSNKQQMQNFLQIKRVDINNPSNAEEQLLSMVGQQLYQEFYKNYTIKQWNRQPRLLPAQIVNRIPLYYNFDDRYFTDQWQYMPSYGYTQLFNQMLDNKNIECVLRSQYQKSFNKDYDVIFYTGKIDKYFDYKYDHLEYRGVEFTKQILDCYLKYPACVINFPQKQQKFTRILEMKHATKVQTTNTCLLYEFPKQIATNNEQMYVINDKKNLDILSLYNLQVINEQNVHFLGRLATYKYINMDQAIANVLNYLKENKLQ